MTKECRRVDEALPAYRAGELAPRRQRLIEAHLGACAGCRQRLEDLDRAVGALERCRPVAPPPGMLRELHARLSAETASPTRWLRRLAPGLVAAGLAAVVWWPHGETRRWGDAATRRHGDAAEQIRRAQVRTPRLARAGGLPAGTVRGSHSAGQAQGPSGAPVRGPLVATGARRGRAERRVAASRERGMRHSVTRLRTQVASCPPDRLDAATRVADAPGTHEAPVVVAPVVQPGPEVSPDSAPAVAPTPAAMALAEVSGPPAPGADLEIVSRAEPWVNPYTGETREVFMTWVADRRTGSVEITLSCPEPAIPYGGSTCDG